MSEPLISLECCCCGNGTKGRQWWNRDTDYGICADCWDINGVADTPKGETAESFGIRGYHWDVDDVDYVPDQLKEPHP